MKILFEVLSIQVYDLVSKNVVIDRLYWQIYEMIIKFIVQGRDDDIELPLLNLAAITTATDNFFPANVLDAGGFGLVCKVTILNLVILFYYQSK